MLNSDLCVGQYIVANLKKPLSMTVNYDSIVRMTRKLPLLRLKNPTLLLPRRYNLKKSNRPIQLFD